jgi:hypothetical protein
MGAVARLRGLRHDDPVTEHDAEILDGHGSDPLTWLQAWYAMQCDGDWEHEFGVRVETLDNPGWSLGIDLDGTAMAGLTYVGREIHRSEHDWFVARVLDERFEVACGPLNLGEAIHEFRLWVADSARRKS